jgi:hypothetical protein
MKMAVFWDVAPCSLVDIDRHFIHHPDNGDGKLFEMTFSIYQTTWCYIPEDSHLQKQNYSHFLKMELLTHRNLMIRYSIVVTYILWFTVACKEILFI